ncbi:hypothetical protein H5T51_04945, partial [Candidatus Bathyarchaeota archaeon]|nr:hypothetical protein [Candidatus Bathyarchaeota archaeon]
EYEKDYTLFFLDFFELEQKALIETAKIELLKYNPDDLLKTIGEFLDWIKNGFLLIDSISTIAMNLEAQQLYRIMRSLKLLTRSFNITVIATLYSTPINEKTFYALRSLSDGLIILRKDMLNIKYMIGTKINDEIFEIDRDIQGRLLINPILPREVSRKTGLKILDILQKHPSIGVTPLLSLTSDAEDEIPASELITILKMLKYDEIVEAYPYCSAIACPYCGSHKSYFFIRCPECESTILEKGEAIEHFKCGHVDFRNKFEKGDKFICPKCGKELNQIGVDYRKAGRWYKCHRDHIFTLPLMHFSCIECNKIYDLDEAKIETQHIYQLSEKGKNKLRKLKEKEPYHH